MMTREEKIEALEGAIELIDEALEMIKDISDEDANFDAYVYRALAESKDNTNPYNQSLQSVLDILQDGYN